MFSMLDPAPDNEQRGPGFKNWMPQWIVYSQVQTSILSKPQNLFFQHKNLQNVTLTYK